MDQDQYSLIQMGMNKMLVSITSTASVRTLNVTFERDLECPLKIWIPASSLFLLSFPTKTEWSTSIVKGSLWLQVNAVASVLRLRQRNTGRDGVTFLKTKDTIPASEKQDQMVLRLSSLGPPWISRQQSKFLCKTHVSKELDCPRTAAM